MEKVCEQWEDMQVGLKNWQAFKYQFSQAYKWYQIRKKASAAANGYWASENHAQEIESQLNTAYSLQAITCTEM